MSGLLLTPAIWADQMDEQIAQIEQNEQQHSAKPKPAAHRMDPAEQVRLQMRLQANKGLVGIVSEAPTTPPIWQLRWPQSKVAFDYCQWLVREPRRM